MLTDWPASGASLPPSELWDYRCEIEGIGTANRLSLEFGVSLPLDSFVLLLLRSVLGQANLV